MAKKSFVDWLYTTAPGRMTLKVLLYTGALKLGEMGSRAPSCLSRLSAGI